MHMNEKEILTFSYLRVVKEKKGQNTTFTVEDMKQTYNEDGQAVKIYSPVAVFYREADLIDYLYRKSFDLSCVKIEGEVKTII